MLREITVMMKTLKKRMDKETRVERKMYEKNNMLEKERWLGYSLAPVKARGRFPLKKRTMCVNVCQSV